MSCRCTFLEALRAQEVGLRTTKESVAVVAKFPFATVLRLLGHVEYDYVQRLELMWLLTT